MAAGLIQLVAKGIEDNYLTTDPQITFFKTLYRRHTNFAIESICQYFGSTANFGETVNCTLSQSGDLVGKVFLYVEMPSIPKFENEIKKIAWARNLGHALIMETSVIIGDKLIDKQYGEWMHIWSEVSYQDLNGLNRMIGNLPEIYEFSNGKNGFKLFIPLEFWFCRNSGLTLPMIALSSKDIKINVVFRKLEECYRIGPTHSIEVLEDIVPFKPGDYIEQTIDKKTVYGYVIDYDYLSKRLFYIKIFSNTSPKRSFESYYNKSTSAPSRFLNEREIPDVLLEEVDFPKNIPYRIYSTSNGSYCTPKPDSMETIEPINLSIVPSITKACLYVDFIYLDDEERKKFVSNTHEYLIEQVQFNQEIGISNNSVKQKLTLRNSCKAHYWVIQLDMMNGPINDHFNYTSSHIRLPEDKFYGKSLLEKGVLILNGTRRFRERGVEYFNWIEPLEHHTRGPKIGINVYSPALYPEQHQPSSSINMDKMDSVIFDFKLNSIINQYLTARIRSYTISYNILRVCFGMCGLVFEGINL